MPAQTWITGRVNLLSLHLTGQLEANGIRLDEGLILQGATLEDSVFFRADPVTERRSTIAGGKGDWAGQSVSLATARVKGQVDFKGADLKGALNMQGADIEGGVFCQSTPNHRTEIMAGAEKTGWAGQSVSLAGAKVKGQVHFSGAVLLGKLNMETAATGSLFFRPEGDKGHSVEIHGDVMLFGAHVTGSCQWQEALVSGGFDGQGLVVEGFFSAQWLALGKGLDLSNAHVTDYLDLSGSVIAGPVDLSHARVDGDFHTGGPQWNRYAKPGESSTLPTHFGALPEPQDEERFRKVLPTHTKGGVILRRAELGGDWLAGGCEIGHLRLAWMRHWFVMAKRGTKGALLVLGGRLRFLGAECESALRENGPKQAKLDDALRQQLQQAQLKALELAERISDWAKVVDVRSYSAAENQSAPQWRAEAWTILAHVISLRRGILSHEGAMTWSGPSGARSLAKVFELTRSAKKVAWDWRVSAKCLSDVEEQTAWQVADLRPTEQIPKDLADLRRKLEELERQPLSSTEAEREKRREELRQKEAQLDGLESAPVLDLRHAHVKGRILFNDGGFRQPSPSSPAPSTRSACGWRGTCGSSTRACAAAWCWRTRSWTAS